MSTITKYVHAATLLCNIHTCLEANQNASHFDCTLTLIIPPTLDEYYIYECFDIQAIYKYGLII